MGNESSVLVFYFNEAVTQFGFVCIFSPCFTLAPLFSLLTNILEITTKMDNMARYSRKFRANGASGIGVWLPMIEFVSFVCIPVNIGIIMYTGHKTATAVPGDMGTSSEASFRKMLLFYDKEWTPLFVLWLAVGIEHGFFAFKYMLSILIGDVPKEVIEAESKRELVE